MARQKAKIDEEKVKADHKAGVPITHIAKEQGCSPDVIRRFLGLSPERASSDQMNNEDKAKFRLEWADATRRIWEDYEKRRSAKA